MDVGCRYAFNERIMMVGMMMIIIIKVTFMMLITVIDDDRAKVLVSLENYNEGVQCVFKL